MGPVCVTTVVGAVVVTDVDFACRPERTRRTATVAASRNANGAPYRFASARQPRFTVPFLPAGDGPDLAPQPRGFERGGRPPVLVRRAERVQHAPRGRDERARGPAREGARQVGGCRALAAPTPAQPKRPRAPAAGPG